MSDEYKATIINEETTTCSLDFFEVEITTNNLELLNRLCCVIEEFKKKELN